MKLTEGSKQMCNVIVTAMLRLVKSNDTIYSRRSVVYGIM